MHYYRKGGERWMLGVGVWCFGAVLALGGGFFGDGRGGGGERAADRYEVPSWEGLEWRGGAMAEAVLVGQGAPRALLAVASNFWAAGEAPAHYVRAMALVLHDQLIPGAKEARLANHQLRYRRRPLAVPEWGEREALGAALWAMAWRAQKLCGDDATVGLLMLDLAAAFAPSDAVSMGRYRELSAGRMELRWVGAVRLPEGIDAPDYVEAAPEGGADVAVLGDLDPVEEEVGPVVFAFGSDSASVLVPSASGAGRGLVRLWARAVEIAREKGEDKGEATAGDRRLLIDFAVGKDNAGMAVQIGMELERARVEFLRRRPGVEFAGEAGVRFEIAGGAALAEVGMVSAAAAVLMEAMAGGVELSPQAGVVGMVGFGFSLRWDGSLVPALLADRTSLPGRGAGMAVRMAVPIFCESEVADLAALGEYRLLMDTQFVGCRNVDDALAAVSAEPGEARARAFALFAEIGKAAERIPPHVLLANARVGARLAEVLALCPEHLSAAQLQRVAEGGADRASLVASVGRLRQIDRQVREWVAGHLENGGLARVGDEGEEALCAEMQTALRALRPRIHPEARRYADRVASLVEDLRVSLRLKSRGGGAGGGAAGRRAAALREAMQAMDVEVASLVLEGA